MSDQRERFYRGLFLVAAVYDVVLGTVFTFFHRQAFELLGAPDALPEFRGFILLIGTFVFVTGIAYLLIYRGDLQRNRDLIAVGALYKLAYSAVALYALLIGEYPHLVFVLGFGVVDVVMLALMAECWSYLRKRDLSLT